MTPPPRGKVGFDLMVDRVDIRAEPIDQNDRCNQREGGADQGRVVRAGMIVGDAAEKRPDPRAQPENHEKIAVDLAERALPEIAGDQECDQVDLGAEAEPHQRDADDRQRARSTGEKHKAGDRRQEKHRGDVRRVNPVDQPAGEQPAAQCREAEYGQGRGRRGAG